MPTDIEWCRNEDGTKGQTWNPVRGCTKISPGCKYCYAETFAKRWRGIPGHAYEQGFDLRLVPEKLDEPLKRVKPTTYFVNSMSDLFHEQVPFEYVAAVFGVMAACPQHTFQVLTKRSERMHDFFVWLAASGPSAHVFGSNRGARWYAWNRDVEHEQVFPRSLSYSEPKQWPWPLPNVWLGVSVEDRKYGLPRIDELRATPAAVRFLSVEPLLEDLGALDLTGIDWVIVGGESGNGARPMHPDWVRNIREQVLAARQACHECGASGHRQGIACGTCQGRSWTGPAFFFKQWGEHCAPSQMPRETFIEWAQRDTAAREHPRPHPGRVGPVRVGKEDAGRELDGRTWDEMPRRRA